MTDHLPASLPLLMLPIATVARVFRCPDGDGMRFTDQPCPDGAPPTPVRQLACY